MSLPEKKTLDPVLLRLDFVVTAENFVESLYLIWWPTDKNFIDHFDDEHFQHARLQKNNNLRSTRNDNEISCEYPFFNGYLPKSALFN
jgi:hypothetical protein